MIIGIYKITSPTGRVYIGQSKNIHHRWNQYKYNKYAGTDSLILYRSFRKHGYNNHKFLIIETCDKSILDEREIFWINHFKCNYREYPANRGLNLTNGGNNPPIRPLGYKLSEAAKLSISLKAKERHRINRLTRPPKVKSEPIYRIKKVKSPKVYLTKEQRSEIISKSKKKYYENNVVSDATRKKMSKSFWNNKTPEEFSRQQSLLFKGRKAPWKEGKQDSEYVEKRMKAIRKPIIQLSLTNNFIKRWDSAKHAERQGGYCSDSISLVCRKKKKYYLKFNWLYETEYLDLQKQRNTLS